MARGNLADFSVTQILNLISLANKTGVLRIYEPIETNDIIKDGQGNPRKKVVPEKNAPRSSSGKAG